ncbi:hypothetical protein [Propionispira arboris]|uniref:hypothetical protein n=1 Tax=Propionispira arboris TaxID=84035 RepID=UPI001FE1312A|nr:hypothetical protein [Propionispira arboris]
MALFQQGDSTIAARKKLLIEQWRKLYEKQEAMKRTIERLDYKIKRHDTLAIGKKHELKDTKD